MPDFAAEMVATLTREHEARVAEGVPLSALRYVVRNGGKGEHARLGALFEKLDEALDEVREWGPRLYEPYDVRVVDGRDHATILQLLSQIKEKDLPVDDRVEKVEQQLERVQIN
jgi:hypothetical protein